MGAMFAAGVIPGIIVAAFLCVTVYITGCKRGEP